MFQFSLVQISQKLATRLDVPILTVKLFVLYHQLLLNNQTKKLIIAVTVILTLISINVVIVQTFEAKIISEEVRQQAAGNRQCNIKQ